MSDNTDDSSGKIGASPTSQEVLGPAAADLDLSQAHIQLCLNLELPLVIVITKYDLATKAGLRQTLSKLLTTLKEAGRRPCIISDPSTSAIEGDLHTVSASDLQDADGVVRPLEASPLTAVPIILTSAVKGTGITKLHAFLRRLPVPQELTSQSTTVPSHLFYIEDVYSVRTHTSTDRSAIIGGYLRYGALTIGDELLLGPYPVDVGSDDSDSGSGRPQKTSIPASRSFPGALNTKRNASLRDGYSEWRRVRIASLRNLRLPVRTLHAGQLGTIGILPVDTPIVSPSINRVRKGMVLAAVKEPKAFKVIHVRFEGAQAHSIQYLSVGSAVVLYVASVRASSKVISVAPEFAVATAGADSRKYDVEDEDEDEDAFGFGFDDEADDEGEQLQSAPAVVATVVTFQFIASREFVELGAKVLVMPGGGPGLSGGNERGAKGLAGLEGFVGRVDEV
ncbi:hypothetical protein N0V83_008242 [Neocucurbitaria cava]|uniref:GTP-binding protein n=1 Tax=Neocucurbitaria cava TaxID=798079 RepID=A0A9W8Y3I5_9PLEO|nr:hypothetical protein N0V83_008242 [Neocucurbitaria cava]